MDETSALVVLIAVLFIVTQVEMYLMARILREMEEKKGAS